MGKKQKDQTGGQKWGKQANSTRGGAAGQQNALAAKVEFNIVDTLRPGRHECLCQARKHELILNCLGCGRIVCAQERSGPCFTCGTLVCTREEREIINRGSKKSAELLKKLTTGSDGKPIGSLQQISNSYKSATVFRDKLLEADADTERRTQVNDLQSDYTNAENNPFLSAKDREALKKRRDELKEMREKERRKFVVSIDLDGGTVHQQKNVRTTESGLGNDPVIQRIMDVADERRRAQEAAHNNASDARWNPKGFIPKYLMEEGRDIQPAECSDGDIIDADSLMIVSDEMAAQITEEKGWTLAMPQPCASFLVNGLIRFVRWDEDLLMKGPLFIASKTGAINEAEIEKFAKKYVREFAKTDDLEFTTGAVLGRAFFNECLLLDDFYDKFGSRSEVPGTGNYVLCFNSFEPLISSVPHIPSGDLYELDRQLKRTLTKTW